VAELWRNWSGEQRCAPLRIERPASREALVEAVGRGAAEGLPVRVAGSGHSFTDIACTDGVLLDLAGLDRVLDADPESGLVRVEAGVSLHELSPLLEERYGLAFENLGDIDRQTLAGAISTGTHGTGARFGNISAQIASIELVLADGSLVELSEEHDRKAFRAARVGLGVLGAIYAVTVRCVPAYRIRRVDTPRPLDETLDRLDELADASDHFELYTFPHTGQALVRESERTDAPAEPAGRIAWFAQEVLLENYAVDAMGRVGRRFPKLIPPLLRQVSKRVGRSTKLDASYRVFASQRRVRFTEMEYGIPREHAAEAVRRVLELIERLRLAVSFPIEVRFVAADDALLSPSHGRDTCYVAVHMYRGMEWEPYFRGVEAIMDSYGGRPHWGKRHFQSAATLAPRYPEWDSFRRVRGKLDPRGVFANEYTDRVLGPVG